MKSSRWVRICIIIAIAIIAIAIILSSDSSLYLSPKKIIEQNLYCGNTINIRNYSICYQPSSPECSTCSKCGDFEWAQIDSCESWIIICGKRKEVCRRLEEVCPGFEVCEGCKCSFSKINALKNYTLIVKQINDPEKENITISIVNPNEKVCDRTCLKKVILNILFLFLGKLL